MNKPERPDPSLKKYLSDPDGGLPAVLSWAVEGAIKYLTSSEIDQLGWCSVVKIAHDVYKKSEDRIGAFLDEELREDAKGSLLVGNLFRTYKMWTDARGERAISQIAFQRQLTDRGMNVEGNGTKATIFGFSPRIHEVPAAQAVNLGDFARYSSSNI
jgi:phage/plasmid-associated DNA primase